MEITDLIYPKILQIMPSIGWFVTYYDDNNGVYEYPILCLALMENSEGITYVELMDVDGLGDIQPISGVANLLVIFHESERSKLDFGVLVADFKKRQK